MRGLVFATFFIGCSNQTPSPGGTSPVPTQQHATSGSSQPASELDFPSFLGKNVASLRTALVSRGIGGNERTSPTLGRHQFEPLAPWTSALGSLTLLSMKTFYAEDGPVLLGPWPDRASAEAVVELALAAGGRRRVARFDRGFTAITRLYVDGGRWWLRPGVEVGTQLPPGLAGFAALPLYVDDAAYRPAAAAAIFRVVSIGDAAFDVEEALLDYRPNDPPDITDLMEAGLRRAAGLGEGERAFVFHEPSGRFSCRVVERTFDDLRALSPDAWRVERGEDGVHLVTSSIRLPPWRGLTDAEWDELRVALGA